MKSKYVTWQFLLNLHKLKGTKSDLKQQSGLFMKDEITQKCNVSARILINILILAKITPKIINKKVTFPCLQKLS